MNGNSKAILVLIKWPENTLSIREVSWADIDSAGTKALVAAAELVQREVSNCETWAGQVIGVAKGDGYKMYSVEPRIALRLGDFLEYPI